MLWATLFAALAAAPGPSCVTADKRLESFISAKAAELGGREYCQFRIYEALHDIDGDGVEDFLVVFSVEGAGGGNDFTQFLGVFPSGSHWAPSALEVGGRGTRQIEKIEVQGREIHLRTLEYAERDPMCCPSRHGEATFVLQQGQVIPAKANAAPARDSSPEERE